MSKRRQISKKIVGQFGDFKSPDINSRKLQILSDDQVQGDKRMAKSFYKNKNADRSESDGSSKQKISPRMHQKPSKESPLAINDKA